MSLDNSSGTDTGFHSVEINAVALDIVQHYALNAGGGTVELSLSSLSFGILTISSCDRSRQGSRRTNVRVPLLSTLLLYISTATYMAALIWNQSSTNRRATRAVDGLFSPSYNGREEATAFQDVVFTQSWMVTIATVTNFMIGDAIVWWRACAIWPHKAVYASGSLLIAVTFALSLAGVYMTATLDPASRRSTILVLFISGNACAFAAGFLSLATNVLATALIAYKAWKHRRLVQKHFAAAGTRSQVLQALALLVESGSMYCVIMTFLVVYEIDIVPLHASAGAGFYRVAGYITRGCVIPLVAIYPAVIIVLVALRRSPIDTGGLSRVAQAHDDSDFAGRHVEEAEDAASADMASAMPGERGTQSLRSEPCKSERTQDGPGGHTKGVEGLV